MITHLDHHRPHMSHQEPKAGIEEIDLIFASLLAVEGHRVSATGRYHQWIGVVQDGGGLELGTIRVK